MEDYRFLLLAPEEKEYYYSLYAEASQKDKVHGYIAVKFFQKSNLSKEALKSIWEQASFRKQSFLRQDEFFIACKYIALVQAGYPPRFDTLRALHSKLGPPVFEGIKLPAESKGGMMKGYGGTSININTVNINTMNIGDMGVPNANGGTGNPPAPTNPHKSSPEIQNIHPMNTQPQNPKIQEKDNSISVTSNRREDNFLFDVPPGMEGESESGIYIEENKHKEGDVRISPTLYKQTRSERAKNYDLPLFGDDIKSNSQIGISAEIGGESVEKKDLDLDLEEEFEDFQEAHSSPPPMLPHADLYNTTTPYDITPPTTQVITNTNQQTPPQKKIRKREKVLVQQTPEDFLLTNMQQLTIQLKVEKEKNKEVEIDEHKIDREEKMELDNNKEVKVDNIVPKNRSELLDEMFGDMSIMDTPKIMESEIVDKEVEKAQIVNEVANVVEETKKGVNTNIEEDNLDFGDFQDPPLVMSTEIGSNNPTTTKEVLLQPQRSEALNLFPSPPTENKEEIWGSSWMTPIEGHSEDKELSKLESEFVFVGIGEAIDQEVSSTPPIDPPMTPLVTLPDHSTGNIFGSKAPRSTGEESSEPDIPEEVSPADKRRSINETQTKRQSLSNIQLSPSADLYEESTTPHIPQDSRPSKIRDKLKEELDSVQLDLSPQMLIDRFMLDCGRAKIDTKVQDIKPLLVGNTPKEEGGREFFLMGPIVHWEDKTFISAITQRENVVKIQNNITDIREIQRELFYKGHYSLINLCEQHIKAIETMAIINKEKFEAIENDDLELAVQLKKKSLQLKEELLSIEDIEKYLNLPKLTSCKDLFDIVVELHDSQMLRYLHQKFYTEYERLNSIEKMEEFIELNNSFMRTFIMFMKAQEVGYAQIRANLEYIISGLVKDISKFHSMMNSIKESSLPEEEILKSLKCSEKFQTFIIGILKLGILLDKLGEILEVLMETDNPYPIDMQNFSESTNNIKRDMEYIIYGELGFSRSEVESMWGIEMAKREELQIESLWMDAHGWLADVDWTLYVKDNYCYVCLGPLSPDYLLHQGKKYHALCINYLLTNYNHAKQSINNYS